MRGRLKEARKQEREHDKNENKEEHADSGTHLAASSSSSFLYSPRWLQKIMVSDNWPVTHINHTQTHMIKRREEPCKNSHIDYWGKTPSFFLSLSTPHTPFSTSSSFSPLCYSHSARTPLAPVAVTMCCRQRPQHVHCLGDERRTDTRSASIRPCVSPSFSPSPRLSPVSRPLLILLTSVPRSPSFLFLSQSPALSSFSISVFLPPPPPWAQEAQLPFKKRKKTEINKPLPLLPHPLALPLA